MLDVPDNRKHLPPSPWTDARIDLLKTLWAAGKSATQICTELGGFEHCDDGGRSAVCGKIHRLGMSNRDRPAKRKNDGGTTVRRINGRSGHTDRSATQRLARKLWDTGPKLRKGKLPKDVPVAAEFLGIPLLDLERAMCRYPRGEGLTITFCGQKVVSGESWCRDCYRIVFQTPKPRVERPYLPLGGSKPRVF